LGRYSAEEIDEQTKYLGIAIEFPCCITVASIMPKDQRAFLKSGWDDNLLYYAAENIANEVFEPLGAVCSCRNDSGELIVITPLGEGVTCDEIGEKLGVLIERYLPARSVISQEKCESKERLSESYLTALERIKSNVSCSDLVRDTKKYIARSYSDPSLSLQTAAEKLYVSPEHLCRIFRRETGATFVDFVTSIRIRRATELLLSSDLKMHEIADEIGFSTQHYFSVTFKRIMGVSPAEYRKGRKAIEGQ
jgi:two-component system response regulator YesN